MKYYAKLENEDIVLQYTQDEDSAKYYGYTTILDYEPISYNGICYTQSGFEKIKETQKYKDEQAQSKKVEFELESKQFENEASYIEYKGKKISLEEILFKSLIYTSLTDAYVYLKTEEGDLLKVLRATFLLIVAKAKINLKSVEEALYNADNQFDPAKSLEENIAKIKGIFDAIDKIFND